MVLYRQNLFSLPVAAIAEAILVRTSLEQSTRGALQDNSRCPLGILTLTLPVQLVPREDHVGNTP